MTIPVYQLELLERHTNHKFAIVKDGTARYLNGDEIPLEHIAWQRMPEDGQYYLSAATCGGSCSVGNPKPKCVKNKIYSPKKCSVYFFYKNIEGCQVSIHEFMSMMDETLENTL